MKNTKTFDEFNENSSSTSESGNKYWNDAVKKANNTFTYDDMKEAFDEGEHVGRTTSSSQSPGRFEKFMKERYRK